MPAIVAYLRVSKKDGAMTTANNRLEIERADYKINSWHDEISGSTSALPGSSRWWGA